MAKIIEFKSKAEIEQGRMDEEFFDFLKDKFNLNSKKDAKELLKEALEMGVGHGKDE